MPDWSLLRPLDAVDLLEQLRSGAVGPQTVLWLNEAQIFLQGQPDVAVALPAAARRGRARGGDRDDVARVLEGAHVRPGGRRPDVNYQTRELLLHDADRVDVPETFTGRDRRSARPRGEHRPAPGGCRRGGGTQRQGRPGARGGPELVQRYDHPADAEDRFGKAVLTAAMDVRRVGGTRDRRLVPKGRGPGVSGSV